LSDARYGAPPVFSQARKQYQVKVLAERAAWKTWMKITPSNMSGNDRYDLFCQTQNSATARLFPFKYAFPALPLDPGKPRNRFLGFDPAVMRRHFVQYRSAAFEYREIFDRADSNAMYAGNASASANRLGERFARKIASKASRLVIGFMGSSVMSGQDNCHGLILSETLRRALDGLLRPFQMSVEPRNMGQNGDGPDMGTQMLCGLDTLGPDLDLLVVRRDWGVCGAGLGLTRGCRAGTP
jgi:hypothetical protein